MSLPKTTFVIMAGGRGERLWPLVRTNRPKVCVSFDGRATLLEAALQRLKPLASAAHTLIVTTAEQAPPIRRLLPRSLHRALLIEPDGKGTAACIALAVASLQGEPDRVLVVLPADHWIRPASSFRRSLIAAVETARQGEWLVTIGLRPTRVHPGLGHLCTGARLGTRLGCQVFRLRKFVEKPSPHAAQRLLRHRGTFWNAGIFVGKVGVFRDAIARWLPQHAARLFSLGAQRGKANLTAYRGLRAVSFDDGVMAHLTDGCVVEGRFGWEDLGSWESWVRVSRVSSPAIDVGSRNIHVVSTHPHGIATVGLRDVTVVHTADATLVCHTPESQALRDVVKHLKQDRRLAAFL